MEKLKAAREFAEIVHKIQLYGKVPYINHLDTVVTIIKEWSPIIGLTPEQLLTLIIAGYLHDTIEDTFTTYTDIKTAFGVDIAELVYAVTNELGRNRRERMEKTYPKIITYGTLACILKSVDRYTNIKHADKDIKKMYKKEQKQFADMLYSHLPPYIVRKLETCFDGE